MTFWSGETLAEKLPELITGFNPDNLDCASYRLCVGDQAFVTSDKFSTSAPTAPLVSLLKGPPDNMVRIRPGQFAFLLTLENVRVPDNAMALISMRAGYKFKGLINVSGFHVDPGWDGKLLFSVYNAGPGEVIVEMGEAMFLIVYAGLDRITTKLYKGASKGQSAIKSSLLQNMTEQVFSPLMLQRRMKDLEDEQTEASRIAGQKLSALEARTDGKLSTLEKEIDAKLASLEKTATSTANRVGIVTATAVVVLGLAIGGLGLLAAIAPGWFGATLAKTLEAQGYDLNGKAQRKADTDQGATLVAPLPPAGQPSAPLLPTR